MSDDAAWPPIDPERLGDAVAALAERVADPDVRAQLHALSGIVRNLAPAPAGEDRAARARELVQAVVADDEQRSLAALRALARHDRAGVRPVDWRAASGG